MYGGSKCFYALLLCILSYLIPLTLVFTAILLSPWFSFWDNALSDLGHAVKSRVAPIFNFALAFAGFTLGLVATRYLYGFNRVRALILLYLGFTLILIGVFDEVYGYLHFIVSILFFIGMIIYLAIYGFMEKSIVPPVIALIHVVMWILHFLRDIPPGAAIPELIAVFTYIPFYTLDVTRACRG